MYGFLWNKETNKLAASCVTLTCKAHHENLPGLKTLFEDQKSVYPYTFVNNGTEPTGVGEQATEITCVRYRPRDGCMGATSDNGS